MWTWEIERDRESDREIQGERDVWSTSGRGEREREAKLDTHTHRKVRGNTPQGSW